MLHIIFQTITNGYNTSLLLLLSLSSILCAILVIISKNPIVSVLYLIGLFLSIAFYLISIGVNFIGMSYLLVYVGAVSILFLFILMLINIRVSELLSDSKNSILLVILVVLFFTNVFSDYTGWASQNNSLFDFSYKVYNLYSYNWESVAMWSNNISSLGSIMYTSYSIWLLLASIILLLAMVGAIVITNKHNNFYTDHNNTKYSLTN